MPIPSSVTWITTRLRRSRTLPREMRVTSRRSSTSRESWFVWRSMTAFARLAWSLPTAARLRMWMALRMG
jgi:hypothetical protein